MLYAGAYHSCIWIKEIRIYNHIITFQFLIKNTNNCIKKGLGSFSVISNPHRVAAIMLLNLSFRFRSYTGS